MSVAEPGGDAHDPHRAALERLSLAPWGARNDKDDQILVPTLDWEHWKRVRYWGVEHLTGFRYGDDHHVVAIVFVQDFQEGTPQKSETCMRRFEAWGRPQIKSYDVKFGQFEMHYARWRDQPLLITTVDGEVNTGFSNTHFSAAWAAYPAYPTACLIYAMAIPWREHGDLAKKVRDRWVTQGFALMQPLTVDRPYRK